MATFWPGQGRGDRSLGLFVAFSRLRRAGAQQSHADVPPGAGRHTQKGVGVDRKGVPAAASRGARTLGWWLFVVCICAVAAWGHSLPARAIGEGVFSLDHDHYEGNEGELLTVGITRSSGGTLTSDITVTVQLVGGTPGLDYPNAAITQIATFKAGTNVSSMNVQFQTNNNNKLTDQPANGGPPIYVNLLSVSCGNQCLPPSAQTLSTVTILGRSAPRVLSVTPKSGGDLSALGGVPVATTITVTGQNFPTTNCDGSISAAQAPLPALTMAAAGRCALDLLWFQPSAPTVEKFHSPVVVLSPTVLQTTLPPSVAPFDAVPYDLRLAIEDPILTVSTQSDAGFTTPFYILSAAGPADRYTYTHGPTITSIVPGNGPVTGGSLVTIHGTGFASPCSVQFGGGPPGTNCTVISDTVLTVVSPPSPNGLAVPADVQATVNSLITPITPETRFNYTGLPTIASISPATGPSGGGTLVTIVGTGFTGVGCQAWTLPGPPPTIPPGNSKVTFGATPALGCSVVSDTQMYATAPPGVGVQQVQVTNNATGSSLFTSAANFTYVSGPSISSLEPPAGPPQGGGSVKIHGSGFAPGAIVTFGGVPAPFITFSGSTLLEVTAPAGTGMVDVVVSVSGVTSPISPVDLYTYSSPVVSSVLPNAGPPAGGTIVVIDGANFTADSTVQFGALTVPATFISTVQIQATAPAFGAQGVVDIRVTTPNGQSAINPNDIFTFTSGPIVAGVNPGTGPTSGGIPVIITGTNFAAGATVTFGGKLSDAVNFNSATQLTALLPASSAPGAVDVVVTTGGGVSPLSTVAKFTYSATIPVIAGISPDKAATVGGQSVEITGTGFLGVTCPDGVKFGTTVATACTVNSDTSITAVAPANVPGQTFLVITSSSGSSEIALNFTYTSTAPPVDGGGGGGGGSGGGSVSGGELPAPTGEQVVYSLSFRWTLLVWRGADGLGVTRAMQGAATTPVDGQLPTDISNKIDAIYGWDPVSASWLAYFTGVEVPGASNLFNLKRGGVYWISLSDPAGATWLITDG